MRLVSVLYNEHYPFDGFSFFTEFTHSSDPSILKPDDVIVVWGGGDIYPGYYNRALSPRGNGGTEPNYRDKIEWAFMQRAKQLGCPIIGVCRGAQMLCALAGGYLMQHINGHGGSHHVVTNEGNYYQTNSIHHQMMVPTNTNHEVLAEIPHNQLRSDVYWDENRKVDHNREPEFIYFTDVKGFAVQWHPEMMAHDCEATRHIQSVMEQKLDLVRII